ncbi:MAG TPA: prepilin-type N-terminal cleavage/methylation domain-containing protein [Terriglobia bacterium]|nr:prepilin-type N-terminal cleavage/methylation domain-containing protein [Terriglobia bacterium]
MSQLLHKCSADEGFTLLEVLIALSILIAGMAALALVSARMMSGGTESKYMNLAASLTSEKLEDLNRWSTADPQICVPTGSTTVGSLTSDSVQTTTCSGGASASVNYFDDVTLANVNGAVSETVSGTNAGGTVYTTTTHAPDGSIQTSTSPTPPASATFHRRWVIEANSPIAGVRRVTVQVTLLDSSVKPPVTFQMSLVRP